MHPKEGPRCACAGRFFLSAYLAMLTLLGASFCDAENVYTSTNLSSTWSNPAEWTSGVPSSGTDTELIFGSSGPSAATFTDDIGTGTFNLNEIQLDSTCLATQTIAANAPANSLTFVANSLSVVPEILQNGSGSFLISNNLVLSNSLTIAGSGSGGLTLSGAISGTGGLTINGASVVSLGGANTYTGITTINSGVLSVSLLSVEGAGTTGSTPSSIGQSNNSAGNLLLNGGTLQYTGPTASTDRLFTLGSAGGTLDASGSGAISFTNTGSIAFATTNIPVSLTLTGTGTSTLRSVLSNDGTGTTSLFKNGAGTWVVSGPDTFTGNVTILAGTLDVNNAAGSLPSTDNVVFDGSGTFLYENTGDTTAKALHLNAITSSGGDDTIEVNYTSVNVEDLLYPDHLGTRAVGATANVVVSGGSNGSNTGLFTNMSSGFINVGTFFGGSAYAYDDGNGYVRAIAYNSDTYAYSTTGGTSISSTNHYYVQTTGNITQQQTATFTSLSLPGNISFSLASGAVMTVNGILKSGNAGGATISGGNGIEASSGAEMVIRTDKSNDALTISTPVLADGTNPLTKSGVGTLTFGAVNTYTGITTLNSGITSFTGASGSTGGGSLTVGGAAGNAVLNLATTGTVTFNGADVGGITSSQSSPSGAGAIDQSSGTFNYSNGTAGYLELGTGILASGGSGAYGGYVLSGGALTANGATSGVRIGSVGLGSFLQSGGNFVLGRELSIGTYGTGVATFTGGTVTGSSAYNILIGEVSGNGTLNLGTQAGGNATLVSQASNGIELAAGSGTLGTLNLNSGTLLENNGSIHQGSGYSAVVNFNGGTLQAGASGLTLIDTTPTAVNIYNRGAVFDTQGFTDTVAAPLLAAGGDGIYPASGTFAVSSGGSGYIGAPLVNVIGGSGSGATAIANISGGVITGVTLTSPGQNYQPGDLLTFNFAGGGPATAALSFAYTLRATDLSLNSAGGLTKLGTGTLILSASNTYIGTTNIINGTLEVDGSLANTAVNVQAGATLAGKGTIANSGTNSVSINGTIAPGNASTDATLTTGPMIWNSGGDYLWKVSQLPSGSPSSGAGTSWDELNVSDLTISATSSQPFTITPIGNPPGFSPTQSYTWQIATLSSAGGSITGFSPSKFVLNTSGFDNGNIPASDFGLVVDSQNIDVSYSPTPEPSTLLLVGFSSLALMTRRRSIRLGKP